MHDKWEAANERLALIDRISQSDVTAQVCPSEKPHTDIALTVASLLEMEGRSLHLDGENFLRHTDKHGIRFAFCPLAAGTTSFEVARGGDDKLISVLKINEAVTSQAQQAAILQFLKEYKSGNVSLHYNAVVTADSDLTQASPGRLSAGTDFKHHDLGQYRKTLQIPYR